MEERISGAEDSIENMETTIKENTKSKNILTQNMQEIQENTDKELHVLKEKQENITKQVEVLKEKQESTSKQVMKWKKPYKT